MATTVVLSDGREFPVFDGEPLSWSPGLYQTYEQEQRGFPKMRAVLRAMLVHRQDQFRAEKREMLRGSFDRSFGHNARKALQVMEEVEATEVR